MEQTIQFSELDLLERYVAGSPAGVFVDVGSHIGGFSQRFAGGGWTVHAFEPDPSNFAELAENLAGFDDAVAVQKAVSDVTDASIVFYQSTEYWGIHSLAPFDDTHTQTIEVPVTRLDDYLRDAGVDHVDVLKVDTEGADKLALEGFDFSADKPRVVMAEYMDSRSSEHFGYTHHDVVKMMAGFGYVCFMADWAPVVRHSRREGGGGPFVFLSCVEYPTAHEPSWGNLIFVPESDKERFAEVLHQYMVELNAEIQATLNEGRGLIDGLGRKVEAQQARIAELDSAIAMRDQRREELDGAVGGRDDRITELQSAISSRDDRLDNLQGAIEGRDDRIKELESAVELRDDRIRELDGAIVGRDTRIGQLDQAVAGRDAKLEATSGELEEATEQLRRSESRLEQMQQDWDAMKAEAVGLRSELNAARRNMAVLAVVAAVLAVATLALALS